VVMCAGLEPMTHPVCGIQRFRREDVLRKSPAQQEFLGWMQRKVPTEENGLYDIVKAARKFRDALCKRLDKDEREINTLPALGAVALLEAPPSPGGTHDETPAQKPGVRRGVPPKKQTQEMRSAVRQWIARTDKKSLSMEDFVRERFRTPDVDGLKRKTEEFRLAVRAKQADLRRAAKALARD
jgi:hypothetical protein